MTHLLGTIGIDFWVNIGIALVGVFIGMVSGYYSHFKKNNKKIKEEQADHDPLDQKHSNTHELITSLRLQLDASRVQLCQFHNGGKFLEGSSMKRFSVTHESCDKGVSMEYPSLQGILITIFWCIVELLKNNKFQITFTRTLPVDSSLRIYNESKNIEAFSMLPIKKNELYVGFVRVDWNDLNNIPNDPEDCRRIIEQYRSFLELEFKKRD